MPLPNVVIDSLDRVWAEKGLQRGFEVPVSNGLNLYGRLDQTGGFFIRRDREFEPEEVAPLLAILRSFGLALQLWGGPGGPNDRVDAG